MIRIRYLVYSGILNIILLIILGKFIFYDGRADFSGLLALVEAERDSLKTEIALSEDIVADLYDQVMNGEVKIDSLQSVIKYLVLQDKIKQEFLDSLILKDSLNTIPLYRKGLLVLGFKPEATQTLTFREIGLGAKIFAETSGLRLQVHLKDEVIFELENIKHSYEATITETEKQKAKFKRLVESAEGEVEFLKEELNKSNSWWKNLFIIYGGWGLYYNNDQLIGSGFQLGVGIKFYSIDIF